MNVRRVLNYLYYKTVENKFVRGQNAGISHNPLEATTSDDMQLAVDAFATLLQQIAQEQAQP